MNRYLCCLLLTGTIGAEEAAVKPPAPPTQERITQPASHEARPQSKKLYPETPEQAQARARRAADRARNEQAKRAAIDARITALPAVPADQVQGRLTRAIAVIEELATEDPNPFSYGMSLHVAKCPGFAAGAAIFKRANTWAEFEKYCADLVGLDSRLGLYCVERQALACLHYWYTGGRRANTTQAERQAREAFIAEYCVKVGLTDKGLDVFLSGDF